MTCPIFAHHWPYKLGVVHSLGPQSRNRVTGSSSFNMKFLKSEGWKKFKSQCNHYIQDYLINTSMHGLKYIGDATLNYSERIYFFVAFSIVTVLSAYFISNLWNKWSENPIIIGLNSASTPLNEIPFPAVTICNMNQARRNIADTIPEGTLNNMLLESVCNLDNQITLEGEFKNQDFLGKWSDFRKFLINVSQPCKEMLKFCRFATVDEMCMDLFLSMLTDEGICCTFNILHPKFMFYHQK